MVDVTAGTMHFGVLGPLLLERDGHEEPLTSPRQRSLLALLLYAAGAPLSRDRLIDELWGDRPPASAVSALHVHLSKLREALGGMLVLEPAGYALAPGRYDLDVTRFDSLVEESRTAAPPDAARLLAEALALFRGEPLCDVTAEGTIARWRRELEEKHLQATLARIDARLATGAAGELVAELERLASEHPFEERVHGQLMLALYRADRQADALDAYQRARRQFASELGLEPGESLARLQQQILSREASLRLPEHRDGTPLSGPARAGARSNVPQPPTKLIGREQELAAIEALLADPDVRMVTLTGTGGVGKTRLLLEVAERQALRFADGAVFVGLEGVSDPALVASEIAAAITRRDGGEGPTADNLARHLHERELLIVLDNFEHLLVAAVVVAELLAAGPGTRVLVSSRTALRIRGEQLFEVEPLELPAGEGDADAARSPAVRLFLDRALASNRLLEVSPALVHTVAQICRALDGLPLAIELAAARSQALAPEEIAEQLARPLSIGERALRDLPARQQTLTATIDWSYQLLTSEAQRLLEGAGLFRGGFAREALEAVAGASAGVELDGLLDASLVRAGARRGRFELLELVRAFAVDQLESRGEAPAARARHRRHFVALVAPASEGFDSGRAPGELAAPLLADHANVRAAFDDAVASGDCAAAQALALGLRPVWFAGMLRRESVDIVENVIQCCEPPADIEIALLSAASFLDGFAEGGGAWTRRLAARAAELGAHDSVAQATFNLFAQALNSRDRDEIRRLRPPLQALLTMDDIGPRALGWAHYFLALDAYVAGDLDEAIRYAALSEQMAREIGHEFLLGSAAGTRLFAQSARDGAIAHDALVTVLELMRRPSVPPLAAFALWLVARYAAAVDHDAAGRWLAHGERIARALETPLWPEGDLRDETVQALGLDGLESLLEAVPALDHDAALAEAIAWLAERDRDERAPRVDSARGARDP